jgi:MFS family permease
MAVVARDTANEFTNRYRIYVLLVLMLVYVFNFLDRQILSILAEDIKHDLGIGDASMGFLLGTSFAVFYAVFGIPLGRAADLINRTRLISVGLLLWSLMTSLSGAANGFVSLASCRMLVGVGEASASPAVYSLLYDYFPKRLRTTAIAIYSSGIFIGAGLGLIVGGLILAGWKQHFPTAASAPLGLRAWQAAFIVVGLPGLLLALWVSTLREPARGISDGPAVRLHRSALQAILEELATLLPGTGLFLVTRWGGTRAAVINVAILLLVAVAGWSLIHALGGALQWVMLGYGVYAFATWCQKLFLTDRVSFKAIFGCSTIVLGSLGFTGCFFLTMGALAWLAVFFQRYHGAPPAEVGLVLGLSYAIFGFLGVTAGGVITDRLVIRHGGRGRLMLAIAAVVLATIAMAALLLVHDKVTAYALTTGFNFFSAMYVAPGAANVNSFAPTRLRATASAAYIVCQVLLGTALGPYVVGVISDHLAAGGATPGTALRRAMLYSLLASLPSVALLSLASIAAPGDEARQRASA